MGDAILMLDDLKAPVKYMSEALKRDVEWVDTVREASYELKENHGRYAILLVEPFIYLQRLSKIGELQGLMASARDEKHLLVLVYSTQAEGDISAEFKLQKGVHYDAYVSKWCGSPERMMATLDRLLPS